MTELKAFLDMGGYAFHVWSAYGIALLVLAANVAAPMLRRRRLVRKQRPRTSPGPARPGSGSSRAA